MVVEKGYEILADDILRLDFFPKNTIMMYDGNNWEDNVTLKGWYKCAGQKVSLPSGEVTMLDLRDRFIFGGGSAGELGPTRGNLPKNTVQLQTVNLPTHNHWASFISSTTENDGHTHTIPQRGGTNNWDRFYSSERNFNNIGEGVMANDTGGYIWDKNTGDTGNHNHEVTGTIALKNTGSAAPFNITPPCYKLIFIKKMI